MRRKITVDVWNSCGRQEYSRSVGGAIALAERLVLSGEANYARACLRGMRAYISYERCEPGSEYDVLRYVVRGE